MTFGTSAHWRSNRHNLLILATGKWLLRSRYMFEDYRSVTSMVPGAQLIQLSRSQFNLSHLTFPIFQIFQINVEPLSQLKCPFVSMYIYTVATYITGCEVAPALLTATGLVNGKWQFSTPHRIDTPQPITKKFVTGNYVGDPYGCAKLGAYPSTGDFRAHGWNITMPFFSGTHLQVRHVDGFSRMMAQTTRNRARMCLFWEFFTLLPI